MIARAASMRSAAPNAGAPSPPSRSKQFHTRRPAASPSSGPDGPSKRPASPSRCSARISRSHAQRVTCPCERRGYAPGGTMYHEYDA
eukprot:1014656-Prymnesium_polylepis.1